MIPVNRPLLNGNEEKYLVECIRSGWISSEGPFVTEFEKKFSGRVGKKEGIAVCNGTAAIDAVISALGIGPGDEVILPAFTIISCISQIVRVGATPVLVDCDLDTWNMDVSQVEKKVTPRTKAIMFVHIYGLTVDVDPLIKIAKKYDLILIEDAAEAHGQIYRGRPCGSLGHVGIFSFYPNKHVTTGEGGMIVTDDPEIASRCRNLRNLCFQPHKRFVHEELGWNYRMTNLQAAIGLAQLERLDEFIAIKRRMGQQYTQGLSDLKGVHLPKQETDYCKNDYWVFGIVLDESTGLDGQMAMSFLEKKGIGCRPFFYPLHKQPVLNRMGLFKNEIYPNSELIYKQGFYIPSGLGLSDSEIQIVIQGIRELLNA